MIALGPYLDAAYRRGGRQWPHVDCWGLYRQIVADHAGVALGEFDGISESAAIAETVGLAMAAGTAWRRVAAGEERALDAVLLKGLVRSGGAVLRLPIHIGCVVRPGWMIDIEGAAGATLRAFRGTPLANRVVGIFRPLALARPQ